MVATSYGCVPMNDVQTAEEKLIKRLVDTAAALGKILHKRGGFVKINVKLSGPKKKAK